jgi:hypothetical protein
MLENRFQTTPTAQDFGPTLKNIAIGIESNAPQIVALLVVFPKQPQYKNG